MSRRLQQDLYAGARGRATLLQAAQSAGAVVVPKIDGSYATVSFGATGALSAIVTRGGQFLPKNLARDYAGIRWIPDSVLVCEAEVWSELGNKVAARRGHRVLWCFDAIRVAGQDVSRESYQQRRDWIMRAESWLVGEDLDKLPTDKRGMAHDTAGRYARQAARCWRRIRVVPSMPAKLAERAWADWCEQDALDAPVEGICVAKLGGKLGGRGAVRKVRRFEFADLPVVQVTRTQVIALYAGGPITLGRGRHEVQVGDVVEVKHAGEYQAARVPRFVSIVRVRHDLSPGGNGAETSAHHGGEP